MAEQMCVVLRQGLEKLVLILTDDGTGRSDEFCYTRWRLMKKYCCPT